jgi:hypothetical protein
VQLIIAYITLANALAEPLWRKEISASLVVMTMVRYDRDLHHFHGMTQLDLKMLYFSTARRLIMLPHESLPIETTTIVENIDTVSKITSDSCVTFKR